jgi:Fe-S cluster biogenesis protein NfuA
MAEKVDDLEKMLREVLAPLLEMDGGEVYLVSADAKKVELHLAGSLGGSPASDLVKTRIVAPAIKALLPQASLEVSSGWRIPEGAQKLTR